MTLVPAMALCRADCLVRYRLSHERDGVAVKKKTVITTETHELWVIHQPSGDVREEETEDSEMDRSHNLLNRPRAESDAPEMPQDEQD